MTADPSSSKIVPVILCGGEGARLWPRSRVECPKPFLPLLGDRTLFQQALGRCADPALFAKPIVVAGEGHIELIVDQCGASELGELIVEPVGRNTAPAIALAAARLDADSLMLICPSDHYIADQLAFHAAVQSAAELAGDGWLVALGITPDRPEVGYGYMKRGSALDGGYRVDRFAEKPLLEDAIAMLAAGEHFWNSGIFVARAGTFLTELAAHRPEMQKHLSAAVEAGQADGSRFHPALEHFAAIRSESVDRAVMELTSRAAMVPVSMGWSDIGNWASLRDALQKDAGGNSTSGDVELVDCENVLVTSDGPRVSALGLRDICVVVDGDEVLVTARDAAANVGKLSGAKGQ